MGELTIRNAAPSDRPHLRMAVVELQEQLLAGSEVLVVLAVLAVGGLGDSIHALAGATVPEPST